jgi:thiol-disulfide isomerase/thioredoxin
MESVILTEETVADFIKDGRVVIRTWDEGCGYCTKYEPIFNEYVQETGVKNGVLRIHVLKDKKPSAFKRAYMKQDTNDNIKETVPGTFVFENGELMARNFGAMSKEQLAILVSDFKGPEKKVVDQSPQQKLYHLFAQKGELVHNIEIMQFNLNRINQEINTIQQPQKAS